MSLGWQISGKDNVHIWELSAMGIVRGGKCPGWEMSMGIVRDGNCPAGGKCPRWELSGMGFVRESSEMTQLKLNL